MMFNGLSLLWSLNFWGVATLAILAVLYLAALLHVRAHHRGETGIKLYHIFSFFAALLCVALVLFTPIDTIARTQLFTVHAFQVVILTTLCAPLLFVGSPSVLFQPLLSVPVLHSVIRFFTYPLLASLLFNLTFLLWHVPNIYHAAMLDANLYHLQLLSIFLTSLLSWWPLLGPALTLREKSYPRRLLYVLLDGQPVGIFAAVLVFVSRPLYTLYAIPPQLSLLPYIDQFIAAALFLVPGLIDLILMSAFFMRWLGQIEQRTRLADLKREEEEWEEWEDDEPAVNNISSQK